MQQALFRLGIDNDIIDYIYPNSWHIERKKESLLLRLLHIAKRIFRLIIKEKSIAYNEANKINEFIDKNLVKTRESFVSPLELSHKCPSYDIYLTGSDQVWNTDYLKGDTSFFFSFIKNKSAIKISYASSFGRFTLNEQEAIKWLSHLNSYKAVSVRESAAIDLIQKYTAITPTLVLDPTLLLTKEEWLEFSRQYRHDNQKPYILVYILTYAWNPFPYAEEVVRKYQEETGWDVLVLEPESILDNHPSWTYIHNASPQEFVALFANASLVITTSFHGTAFSINLEVPFYSIVTKNEVYDDRIDSLLNITQLNSRKLYNNAMLERFSKPDYICSRSLIETERSKSIDYLSNTIKIL